VNRFVIALVGASAAVAAAQAQSGFDPASYRKPVVYAAPNCPPGLFPGTAPGTPGSMPGTPGTGAAPFDPNAQPMPNQEANTFGTQREAGGQNYESFNPNMFGDFPGVGYSRGFPRGLNSQTQSALSSSLSSSSFNAEPPLLPRYQGVKLTENNSPRPQDRVSVAYNFYDNISGSEIDIHRETIFFEKTFAGGDASVEFRLPFLQWTFPGGGYQRVGDITMIGKYAFYNDTETGDLFSGGVGLTFPTGASLETDAAHSALIQPYLGFIKNSGNWFAQGFSSLIVPTDSDELMVWFNSVGVGYWVYRGNGTGWLNGIIPITEVHVNTPLNHRDPGDASFIYDQVSLTSGAHFVLGRSVVGTAVNVPISGPRPWNIEAVLTWNVRY
jgi:hypothetical protein